MIEGVFGQSEEAPFSSSLHPLVAEEAPLALFCIRLCAGEACESPTKLRLQLMERGPLDYCGGLSSWGFTGFTRATEDTGHRGIPRIHREIHRVSAGVSERIQDLESRNSPGIQ